MYFEWDQPKSSISSIFRQHGAASEWERVCVSVVGEFIVTVKKVARLMWSFAIMKSLLKYKLFLRHTKFDISCFVVSVRMCATAVFTSFRGFCSDLQLPNPNFNYQKWHELSAISAPCTACMLIVTRFHIFTVMRTEFRVHAAEKRVLKTAWLLVRKRLLQILYQ